MKSLFLPAILAAFLLLSACLEETQPVPSPGSEAPKPLQTWLPLTIGGVPIEAQFAIEPREQSKGLMDRDHLAENHGMLFVFPKPQPMSFWMRRTRIPLDIGYFTPDGILREVYQMEPFDETSVTSTRRDLQYALEMNQGWFATQGVKPGAKLDMEQLKAGLLARGYDPARMGIR